MQGPEQLDLSNMRIAKLVKGRLGVWVPDHPKANSRGYVLLARWIMEQHIGRYLTEFEQVHHINGVKNDDRLENLMIVTRGEHFDIHADSHRTLDYSKIKELMDQGLGYCKIAKQLGYNMESVKSAVRRIRAEKS